MRKGGNENERRRYSGRREWQKKEANGEKTGREKGREGVAEGKRRKEIGMEGDERKGEGRGWKENGWNWQERRGETERVVKSECVTFNAHTISRCGVTTKSLVHAVCWTNYRRISTVDYRTKF